MEDRADLGLWHPVSCDPRGERSFEGRDPFGGVAPSHMFDQMAKWHGRRFHTDDPPARSADPYPYPDRIQQRRRPRSGRDDHGVREDPSLVGHDPADGIALLDQGSGAEVVPDLGPGRVRGERQRDGQRPGIQPVSLVQEPAGHRFRRDCGLGVAQPRGVERLDRHA